MSVCLRLSLPACLSVCLSVWPVSGVSQSQMAGFLQLVGLTVESYLSTYSEDSSPLTEDSEEVQFVLSLCGTVTSE